MALDTRHVHLLSPVKPDELMLQRVSAVEELGRPFAFELDLLSPDPVLKLDALLGDLMTVVLALPDGERYFNGHVARIGQAGKVGRYTRYSCTLRPFLWLLTRASDSRIYKKLTVPQIIKDVVAQFGFGQVDDGGLQGNYPTREYTVQYRESYFNFLSRLMEEEGIYYFFRHEKSSHVMVLCDDHASHARCPDYETIPFIDPQVNAAPREEHIAEWAVHHEVQSGAFVVNDYDFEVPRADLLAKLSRPLPHKHASLEQYDPLAGFVEGLDAGNDGDVHRAERGELFARVRLEELQAEHDRATGRGNVRGPFPGAMFELSGHPRDDQNGRELLVVRTRYTMFQPGFDAGSAAGRQALEEGEDPEPLFEVEMTVQPSKVPFRPRRTTPRPFIPGPHTAIVVGQGEIWTDKHGRVKVHFPWDREDTEGCWVRVSQVWAGGGWGGLQVPRVGQEMLVEFIEGDPDRPIITGRVYNGANPPPFGLPDGATKSGLLTRSSTGGSADNASEISFEDKHGSEVLNIHAEKDMTTSIENDQAHSVGHDRTRSVGNDEKVEVGNNQTQKIGSNQTENVGVDQKLDVGANQSITVGANQTESVTANRTDMVGGNETRTVSGNRTRTVIGAETITVATQRTHTVGISETITVGAALSLTVGATSDTKVGGNASETIGGAQSVKVAKDIGVEAGANETHTAAKNITGTAGENVGLTAGKKFTIEAGDEILIKTGKASITMKKDGTIVIDGKDIQIKGSGEITAKADKDVTIKGTKIKQN